MKTAHGLIRYQAPVPAMTVTVTRGVPAGHTAPAGGHELAAYLAERARARRRLGALKCLVVATTLVIGVSVGHYIGSLT